MLSLTWEQERRERTWATQMRTSKCSLFIQSLLQQENQPPSLEFDRDTKADRVGKLGMRKRYAFSCVLTGDCWPGKAIGGLTRSMAGKSQILFREASLTFPTLSNTGSGSKTFWAGSYRACGLASWTSCCRLQGRVVFSYVVWPLSVYIFSSQTGPGIQE